MTDPSTEPHARRGARPWGLVGALCLVLLAERSVARRSLELLDFDDWAYVRNARWAEKAARGHQILFLGDSLTKYGVVPRAVAERSGRTAYNLALPGSQPPAAYMLLKRALGAGARPEAVVLDAFPVLLAAGPRHNLSRWASLAGPRDAAALAWEAADPGLFGVIAAGRWLPSVRARAGIRDNVAAALKGRTDWRRWVIGPIFRNWARNGGAQLMPSTDRVRSMTSGELDDYRTGMLPRVACGAVNRAYLHRLLALAGSHGVKVYWALPPVPPSLRAATTRSGYDAAHEAFLAGWLRQYPGLTVVDGRDAVADPGAFHDPIHLAGRGAYAYSLALGDALRRHLPARAGAARWVTLPAVDTPPTPEGVEDYEQSRLALRESARPRR